MKQNIENIKNIKQSQYKKIISLILFVIVSVIIYGCNISYNFGSIVLICLMAISIGMIFCGIIALIINFVLIMKDCLTEKKEIEEIKEKEKEKCLK